MYLFTPAYAATLLAATALAAPAPAGRSQDPPEGVSFKIARPGLKGKTPDGRAELDKAFRKFGLQFIDNHPSDASDDSVEDFEKKVAAANGAAANGTDQGEVAATPENGGAEFLEKVQIGKQQFDMDFDTGSSNLWVFSNNLAQAQIGGHAAFNANQSATFKPIQGGTFQISYGDGSFAAGTVGKDDVTIGGVTVNTAVGPANNVAQQFVQDTNNDGLVGLAFDSINTVKINGKAAPQKTFFSDVQGRLKQPLFAADLAADKSGSYEFGNIDTTRFTGDLKKVPVNNAQGFWQFGSNFATVDGAKVANQGGQAIADTGTSLLLVANNVATGYYKKVQGAQFNKQAGGFIYPCASKLPDFGVDMGGAVTAVVPGDQVTFQKLTKNVCFGGIQSNGGTNLQIYGDTFFKANYVVFDSQGPQLQVAPKK